MNKNILLLLILSINLFFLTLPANAEGENPLTGEGSIEDIVPPAEPRPVKK